MTEIRIAIVGDPVRELQWHDDAMDRLRAIGFNTVQLNMAWGTRPHGEALNLIDVVSAPGESDLPGAAKRRAELKMRAALARRHGLRVLFHFGSPYMDRNPESGEVPRIPYHIDNAAWDSWYDILNPKVRDHELALLREFRRQFPEVQDILVYTYDQDAWQTPEFQFTKYSYAIPLSDRLPGYLADLHNAWTEGRVGEARMWWEPWELSAGQVFAIIPQLPRTDFGLMIHSNFAEVQLGSPVDTWFRATARLCRDLGIPVVAEGFFASATEEIEPLAIPMPRLVDEQFLAFASVPGIVGIKEYFGLQPMEPDLSVDMLQARLRNRSASTEELTDEITRKFGSAQSAVRRYLDLLSNAFLIYPWDASWRARKLGLGSIDHGWSAATIRGMVSKPMDSLTPAWDATRFGRFMKVDWNPPHFWMLEDVGLRCGATADILEEAAKLSASLIDEIPDKEGADQFRRIQGDVVIFMQLARSYALHLRETNVAQMLRQDLVAGRPLTPALVEEMDQLLSADESNQGGNGRVVEMRRLFAEDAQAFVRRYLAPGEGIPSERGQFTLTTR